MRYQSLLLTAVAALSSACVAGTDNTDQSDDAIAIICRPGDLRCKPPRPPLPPAPLNYNDAFQYGTHNSYWDKRDNVTELQASGTRQRLLDQLLFDHVRALELDIHRDDSTPHNWTVYHTDKQSNSFCSPLAECLKELRLFHYANPQHEVVTVVLELKEILKFNFDDTHTPQDLDAIIRSNLPGLVYEPAHFLSRCANGLTMRQCAAQAGWPSIQELRGKFMFAVMGNWRGDVTYGACVGPACVQRDTDEWEGHGPSGWVTYASSGVYARAAFPMECNWIHFNTGHTKDEDVDPGALQRAKDASIFLQTESLHYFPTYPWDQIDPTRGDNYDPAKFVGDMKGVVRIDNVQMRSEQAAAVAAHAQILQTDAPWSQIQDRGILQPIRPIDRTIARDPADLYEPGAKVVFYATHDNPQRDFSWRLVGTTGTNVWETMPSSTRPTVTDADAGNNHANPHRPKGKGCLRATSLVSWGKNPNDPDRVAGPEGITVCREVQDGAWNGPLDQNALITVEIRHGGWIQSTSSFTANANTARGVGDQLRLDVSNNGSGACATAYSAGGVKPDGTPDYQVLKSECFPTPLQAQGLVAERGDVAFFGTRVNGDFGTNGHWFRTAGPGSSYLLVDYSTPATVDDVVKARDGTTVNVMKRGEIPGNHLPTYGASYADVTAWGSNYMAGNDFSLRHDAAPGWKPLTLCLNDGDSFIDQDISLDGTCPVAGSATKILGYYSPTQQPGLVPLYVGVALNGGGPIVSSSFQVVSSTPGYHWSSNATVWVYGSVP